MTIEVTADDIRDGVRDDTRLCAVARATSRTTGQLAYVNSGHIRLVDNVGRITRYFLSESLHDWIERFDSGCDVHPITFGLAESGGWRLGVGDWSSGTTTSVRSAVEPEPELVDA